VYSLRADFSLIFGLHPRWRGSALPVPGLFRTVRLLAKAGTAHLSGFNLNGGRSHADWAPDIG